jgi:hypothetical protein
MNLFVYFKEIFWKAFRLFLFVESVDLTNRFNQIQVKLYRYPPECQHFLKLFLKYF